MKLQTSKRVLLLIALGVMSGAVSLAQAQYQRIADPLVLQRGGTLFQQHCASCHGLEAQGTVEDWHIAGADGKYPPPPLDGTAHTWHHSIERLTYTIRNGTAALGGSMPAWQDKLSDDEIFSIIAWISSLWPEEIYTVWRQRNEPTRNKP